MRSEDVRLGMLVWAHRGSRERALRGRIGIVTQRFGNDGYSPFGVRFEDEQLELLWAAELKEAMEFYEHYG